MTDASGSLKTTYYWSDGTTSSTKTEPSSGSKGCMIDLTHPMNIHHTERTIPFTVDDKVIVNTPDDPCWHDKVGTVQKVNASTHTVLVEFTNGSSQVVAADVLRLLDNTDVGDVKAQIEASIRESLNGQFIGGQASEKSDAIADAIELSLKPDMIRVEEGGFVVNLVSIGEDMDVEMEVAKVVQKALKNYRDELDMETEDLAHVSRDRPNFIKRSWNWMNGK